MVNEWPDMLTTLASYADSRKEQLGAPQYFASKLKDELRLWADLTCEDARG